MMRVLHVGTYDIVGGAARAAYRLHSGLSGLGHESNMFVRERTSSDPSVKQYQLPMSFIERAGRVIRRERLRRDLGSYVGLLKHGSIMFSDDRSEQGDSLLKQMPACDIVNLHWVCGFMDYQKCLAEICQRTPVVWTLHDMNPFTGGCHYDEGCGRFTAQCGACPQRGSSAQKDLSRRILSRKQKVFEQINPERLHLVTPSNWLKDTVLKSSLMGDFPVTVIPNSVDTEVFAPRGRSVARQALGISENCKVVMFGAHSVTDKRKGLNLLLEAMDGLSNESELLLISVGKNPPSEKVSVPFLHLGEFANDRLLSLVYSAADVLAMPSTSEVFGLLAIEAMACGTPVVGFSSGGLLDIVRPGQTGWLATPGDAKSLRESLRMALTQEDAARNELSEHCRQVAVDNYALPVTASRYAELYKRMLV
jgi:glycosyltransferase involved in cell wall biosynthesis